MKVEVHTATYALVLLKRRQNQIASILLFLLCWTFTLLLPIMPALAPAECTVVPALDAADRLTAQTADQRDKETGLTNCHLLNDRECDILLHAAMAAEHCSLPPAARNSTTAARSAQLLSSPRRASEERALRKHRQLLHRLGCARNQISFGLPTSQHDQTFFLRLSRSSVTEPKAV
jgi:hypothetical protein